ncbi:glycosyltransferase [Bacteriovoracaceae bacterium]|nr:glycosyltransferase [Bacteriovoracaceae bacterium]
MRILAIGHAFIVDTNRKVFHALSKLPNTNVDMVLPRVWQSNLVSTIEFQESTADESIDNIYPIDVYRKGNGSFYFYHFDLFNIFRNNTYDFIYIWQEPWSISAAQAIFFAKITSSKNAGIYLQVAQNIRKKHLTPLIPWERFLSRSVTEYFCCSEGVRDVIRWKKLDAPDSLLSLGFDESLVKDHIHFPVKKGKITLGYIGRLSPEKGLDDLISATELYYEGNKEIQLVIAGNGPLSSKLSQYPFIKYLGVLSHKDVGEFYNQIDFCVVPSKTTKFWKEQFGRVLIEAVAAGKITIGSNSGSIPEVMGSMDMPFVFEEGNVDQLSNLIRDVAKLIGTGEAVTIAQRSKDIVLRQYSNKAIATKIYQTFINKNPLNRIASSTD